jgi:hypothetical protein
MMGEDHRLRSLKMGKAWEDDVGPVFRPPMEHVLEGCDSLDRVKHGPAKEQAKIKRDLVVSAARGVELTGDRANDLAQLRFDVGVNVFECVIRRDVAAFREIGNLAEAGFDRVGFLGRDDALPTEHAAVSDAAEDVFLVEATIEGDRLGEFLYEPVRLRREAASPLSHSGEILAERGGRSQT